MKRRKTNIQITDLGGQTRLIMAGRRHSAGENSYEDLVRESRKFFSNNKGCIVRTSANLIANNKQKRDTIEKFANNAYPIIHESLLGLIQDFLTFKLRRGTSIERDFYKEMSLPDFVDRLICKRPLVFFMPVDSWIAKVD